MCLTCRRHLHHADTPISLIARSSLSVCLSVRPRPIPLRTGLQLHPHLLQDPPRELLLPPCRRCQLRLPLRPRPTFCSWLATGPHFPPTQNQTLPLQVRAPHSTASLSATRLEQASSCLATASIRQHTTCTPAQSSRTQRERGTEREPVGLHHPALVLRTPPVSDLLTIHSPTGQSYCSPTERELPCDRQIGDIRLR